MVVFAAAFIWPISTPTLNKTNVAHFNKSVPVKVQPAPTPVVQEAAIASQAPAPVEAQAQPEPEPQPAPTYVGGSHEDWMTQAGITPSDFGAVEYIVSHESGWCPYKHEGQWGGCPDSPNYADGHAYGLCQALPGTKLSSAGDDWLTNPITQLRWCNSYAASRYGGWWASLAHWQAAGNW